MRPTEIMHFPYNDVESWLEIGCDGKDAETMFLCLKKLVPRLPKWFGPARHYLSCLGMGRVRFTFASL